MAADLTRPSVWIKGLAAFWRYDKTREAIGVLAMAAAVASLLAIASAAATGMAVRELAQGASVDCRERSRVSTLTSRPSAARRAARARPMKPVPPRTQMVRPGIASADRDHQHRAAAADLHDERLGALRGPLELGEVPDPGAADRDDHVVSSAAR